MASEDTTIAEIRKIRHEISRECNHDPKKVVEYYIKLQQEYQDRLLTTAEVEDNVVQSD